MIHASFDTVYLICLFYPFIENGDLWDYKGDLSRLSFDTCYLFIFLGR